MDKKELAQKISDLIDQDGGLLTMSNTNESEMDLGNVMYNYEMDPCIVIFQETEEGLRKRFTITISDDTELNEKLERRKALGF